MTLSFLPRWYVPPHLRVPPKRKAADVINAVMREFGVTKDELKCSSRKRHVARARQVAWYSISRNCPHISYPQMARMLGRSDHSTAIHGVHLVTELIARDGDFADAVARVERTAFHG